MISFCQDISRHARDIWISGNTYDRISVWLNLLTLQFRQQHVNHLYLTNVFKNKVSWVFILDSISLWRPTWTITDYSFFITHHHLKISPSAMCVFAGNVICRNINIFSLYTLDSTLYILPYIHSIGIYYCILLYYLYFSSFDCFVISSACL
jgi:hypothetical protein